jgi:diaminopropionate ammonia-lyase family
MSTPNIYINPSARNWTYKYETNINLAQDFHKRFPNYAKTPLIPLPDPAKELGVRAVFVKDQSNCFGLPAFKILGASWGTFRAIAEQTALPLDSGLDDIASAARKAGTILFAATEGNHGRAVARMGKILSIPVRIIMSKYSDREIVQKIESEGANVTVIQGTYDDAVAHAFAESQKKPAGLLIQDNAFEGYEEVPAWIVEGYSTMLFEVEEQLKAHGLEATSVITPIGVGSLGHAVIGFCKSDGRYVRTITVEPENAACLHQNLKAGKWETIETSATIANGMNCGTVSPISWPVLSQGVDISMTVSEVEIHKAVRKLQELGVSAGPCGAAPLAALLKLCSREKSSENDSHKEEVFVLLNTEGSRGYPVPLSTTI